MRSYLLLLAVLVFSISRAQGQAFTEVTAQSGINHVFHVGDWMFGGGVAVLDYDNDGLEDLYITGGVARDVLYKNNGDGTFTEVSAQANLNSSDSVYTMGAVAGDIDNDGFKDLYVTTRCLLDLRTYTTNILYRNNGDGTFTDITVSAGMALDSAFSTSASFGDYNLDGYIDLVVGNFFEDSVLHFFDTSGTYYNRLPDDGAYNYLYLNNGNNTFTEVGQAMGLHSNKGPTWTVAFSDYDNDADVDIIVGNDFGYTTLIPNTIHQNQYPANNFLDVGSQIGFNVEMHAMGTAVGDFNEDGWLDYYMTDVGTNRLYESNGGGTFDSLGAPQNNCRNPGWFDPSIPRFVRSIGWGTMFMDYDHDTYLDLFISNGSLVTIQADDSLYNPNALYRNNATNGFSNVSSTSGLNYGHTSRGSVMFDYDKDGDQDILTVEQTWPTGYGANRPVPAVRLFENNTNGNNKWLQVKLRGVTSNRDGLGARIRIVTGGRSMIREVDGGSTCMSSSTPIVHFGIGQNQEIDTVEVTWPGGYKQVRTYVNPNQTIVIVEGANEYTWTGLMDGNWNNLDNWLQLAVPSDSNDIVIIPSNATNYPDTATAPIHIGSLVLNDNVSMSLASNTSLTIKRNLTIDNNAELIGHAVGSTLPSVELRGDVLINGVLDATNMEVSITDPTLVINGTGTLLLHELEVNDGTIFFNSDVELSEKLTVTTGATVQVNGNLIMEPGAILVTGEDTPGGGGTLMGTVTATRNSNNYSGQIMNFWGTPVQGQDLTALATPFEYIPANAPDLTVGGLIWGWDNASGNMIPGKGYASGGNGLATFSGLVNDAPLNDPIMVNIDKNVGSSNNNPWNAVSNPFPAYLDAKKFIESNGAAGSGVITSSVYAWDDDSLGGFGWYGTEECAVYNPNIGSVPMYNPFGQVKRFSGYFALGQGFFVEKVNNGTHAVKYTNDMRSDSASGVPPIQTTAARVWIGLSNTNNQYSETLLAFKADATDGFDPAYDAKRKKEGPMVSISTRMGNDNYAIQTVAPPIDLDVIPVFIDALLPGSYKLQIMRMEQLNSRVVLLLEDVTTGSLQNLRVNSQYNFSVDSAQAGAEIHRFNILVIPEIDIDLTAFDCSANQSQLILNQAGGHFWNYVVKDNTGAIVANGNNSAGITTVDGIAAGSYTIELTDTFGYTVTHPVSVLSLENVVADFSAPAASLTGEIVSFSNLSIDADAYAWDFGDGSPIDTSAAPTHTYAVEGTYTVSLTAINQDCEATASKTITVDDLASTVAGLNNHTPITAYTFDKQLHVTVQMGTAEKLEVLLYNSVGQKVYHQHLICADNETIELAHLPDGFYVLTINNPLETLNKSIVLSANK